MTLQEQVNNIFAKHNINYDCEYNCDAQRVIITIIEGDWKHDHRFLKNVMTENGFECVDEYITDSDCDCYDCEYTFQLK